MKKIKEVIVVEGKHDVALLKKIYEVHCIITNGSHLGKAVLEEIGYYVDNPGVIVFTDPDYVGEMIRKKIMNQYPQVKHVYIDKKKARTSKKVGVEHANIEDIKQAFKNVATYTQVNTSDLCLADLMELKLLGCPQSNELRNQLATIYPIGQCNGKTCLHRLQYLNVTKEELKEKLYGKNSDL